MANWEKDSNGLKEPSMIQLLEIRKSFRSRLQEIGPYIPLNDDIHQYESSDIDVNASNEFKTTSFEEAHESVAIKLDKNDFPDVFDVAINKFSGQTSEITYRGCLSFVLNKNQIDQECKKWNCKSNSWEAFKELLDPDKRICDPRAILSITLACQAHVKIYQPRREACLAYALPFAADFPRYKMKIFLKSEQEKIKDISPCM